jgi:hypothetical protein
MTETNRYKNGKIYKLISPHTNKIYVGSTCKERLCQRLASHKNDYKFWLKDNNNGYKTSYVLFDLGDVEIILLESVDCLTKDELLKKEREWIEKYKDIIVNKYRPITTKEEHKERIKEYNKVYQVENKEYFKEYCDKNKEHISQRDKEYNEKNNEKIKEYHKEYYNKKKEHVLQLSKEYRDKNKEHIIQRSKEYYNKIKEKLKEQIQCDCGVLVQKTSKSRHTKTQTHQQYINSLVSQSVLKT